jgi:hypothetical protein
MAARPARQPGGSDDRFAPGVKRAERACGVHTTQGDGLGALDFEALDAAMHRSSIFHFHFDQIVAACRGFAEDQPGRRDDDEDHSKQ